MNTNDLDINTLDYVLNLLSKQVNKLAGPASYHSGMQDGFRRSAILIKKLIDEPKNENCNTCNSNDWINSGIGRKYCKCGNLKCSDCQILRGEFMDLEKRYRLLAKSEQCLMDIFEISDKVGTELAKMCGEKNLEGIEPTIDMMEYFEKVKARYDNLELYLKQSTEDFRCLPDCDSYSHNEYCPVTNSMAAFHRVYNKLKEYEKKLSELS